MCGKVSRELFKKSKRNTEKDMMLQPLIAVLWVFCGVMQCTGCLKEESRDCMDGMRAGVCI
jgi:hypothetical protein